MWPCDVHYGSLVFPSAENAYQAAKFPYAEREAFTRISPYEAKKRGKIGTRLPDFDTSKVVVMHYVLESKFFESLDLKRKLLATGDKHLEEVNWWGDLFWGVCEGEGLNHLGKLLMRVRETLRK